MKKFQLSERLTEVIITSVISTISAFAIQWANEWARARRNTTNQ